MWNNASQNDTFHGDGGFNRDSAPAGDSSFKINNLVHTMIADYINHEDEVFTFEGMPVDLLTFVGTVKNIDPTDGMMEFLVEDETGSIKVKHIVDPQRGPPTVNLESLVRVFCSPKMVAGIKSVLALRIVPLPMDDEEIECHKMHVEYDRMLVREFEQAKSNPTAGVGSNSMNGTMDSMPISNRPTGSAAGGGGNTPKDIVTRTLRQLIAKQGNNETGATILEIAEVLRGRLSEDTVRRVVIDEMVADGSLYSTIDDDHFNFT